MCRVKLEGGPLEEALDASTNLLAAAGDNPVFTAESYQMLRGHIPGIGAVPRGDFAAYESILSNNLPMEQKRKAVLNIIELDLAQNQTDEAARRLDDFLQKNAGEKSSDFDLLALGELRLRQHFQAAGDTNFLRQAETNFVRLDTNSDFWGKAQLNLGWCLWEEGKFPESGVAFSNAVGRLPHGEDQAVALFKLGDVLYSQTNYARAIGAYSRIFDGYGAVPSVTNNLLEPALYQIVQAATAMTNLTAANDALKRILNWFPEGLLGQPAMLLLGETEDRAGSAAAARRIFTDFIARWPASPLRPEAELAVARTYERENDWTNAINRLYAWVVANTNSPALPQAEFQLACANYQAGNDSNAFSGFTNFIATYPANALAAQAWYWIGTYHFQREEYELAEVSFKGVFATNMAATAELQNQARMMAGKSAYGRRDYGVAIKYFEDLKEDTNDCPANVRLTAQYAWGDAEISSVSLTNLSPYQSAIAIFGDIVTNHPDDLLAPLAWGRMGDCYRQLGAANDTNQDWFALATAAYTNVISSSNADLATRCTAEYGVGQALENMARSMPPGSGERTNLLQLAVDHYLNVVTGSNLRGDEEHRDPYWVWQTGMAAGRIESDDLKELDKALNLYQTLQDDLPPLQVYLGKKIAGILGQMAPLEHSGPVRDD
jgi:TolA-binding protein